MSESDEAFEEVSQTIAVFLLCVAFGAGYLFCSYVKEVKAEEAGYREKVNFCHDRMKNKDVALAWKIRYCGKVKIEAIDPITRKPVMGIVEGE